MLSSMRASINASAGWSILLCVKPEEGTVLEAIVI